MGQEDYKHVLDNMRLAESTIWPMPITLNIGKAQLPEKNHWITLRDVHNHIMTVMCLEEIFRFH